MGIKLLGLRTVREVMRVDEEADAVGGEPIDAGLSLREALSVFVTRRVDALRVVDDQQRTLGSLHVADLLKAPP